MSEFTSRFCEARSAARLCLMTDVTGVRQLEEDHGR